MNTMQQPGQRVLMASPTSIQPLPPSPPSTMRLALPDRNVDVDTIEDAYVAFILCCNPAVPLETDTTALREAFRTPPKSGGKSFSTFTLFELIKKLETKELKTWAELALKLGVEPPDQEKGQSVQKIQQYAVRLKRWMHSMHVDAFFEYLIGRQSTYWTEIPSEHTPVAELERDGVAAEDDMALRALLPHIKPRRGRRKPEDEETGKSPSRRPSPQADDGGASGGGSRQEGMEPWTAQPDGRGSVFLFPPAPDPSRSNLSAVPWASNEMVQTPLTAHPMPQSAITPSTRNTFWADEPRSALTPSKPRSTGRRHGAKVVSSAWRSNGLGGSGKTRGRPPMNRGANTDGPFSAFPTSSETPVFRFPSPTPEKNTTPYTSTPGPTSNPQPAASAMTPQSTAPTPAAAPPQQMHNQNQPSPISESPHPRPAKRSRLSLQVPERVGGEVRLATPPLPEPVVTPVVMVNGQSTTSAPQPGLSTNGNPVYAHPSRTTPAVGGPPTTTLPAGTTTTGAAGQQQPVRLQDPTDRTNMDDVEALFMHEVLRAEWYDAQGNKLPPCGAGEAWALVQSVIANLLKTAATKEAFLINLAALVGGKVLMNKGSLRVTRSEELPDRTRYSCVWELRFGDITGQWTMEEVVMHDKWKGGKAATKDGQGGGVAATNGGGSSSSSSAGKEEENSWERRYMELAAMLQKRDQEMMRLRAKVIESIRDC